MTPKDVIELAKKNNVEFVDLMYGDMFGILHHFSYPVWRLDEEMFKTGIAFDGGVNNFVVDNRVSAVEIGILFDGGGTGKYRGNLTSGTTTPYSGGTDVGDNN